MSDGPTQAFPTLNHVCAQVFSHRRGACVPRAFCAAMRNPCLLLSRQQQQTSRGWWLNLASRKTLIRSRNHLRTIVAAVFGESSVFVRFRCVICPCIFSSGDSTRSQTNQPTNQHSIAIGRSRSRENRGFRIDCAVLALKFCTASIADSTAS